MDVTRYHELAQSLEASQKTLTEIADHLEQCVWIKDPSTAISGRMTYASPAFERIFGIPSESLHGRPDALFDLVHPEDLPRFRETNMMQFEREYDIEYRLNRSDGALRWLWSRAMPVRDSAGRVVRLVGITEDITSRKDNETRIRELNAELEQMVRSEQELSRTDALTGLGNRLRCTEEGDRLWKNTQRESERTGQSRSLAAVAVDLDHLKQVNDRHGHAAGDACLRSIAQVLRASVREVDVAARVGGDEFILLLPNTSLAQARQVAERILQGLGQVQVVHTTPEGAVMLSLSASIGVAAMDGLDLEGSVSRLQSRADKALYCAKQAGRQRVETADGGRE
jgi:diguanylate cyclase (GGDEF)-like protein/PAS domain S-box-containing protein